VTEKMAAGVAVDEVGAGEPVLLVHGTVVSGKATWRRQRPLADRWWLLVMERRGYARALRWAGGTTTGIRKTSWRS